MLDQKTTPELSELEERPKRRYSEFQIFCAKVGVALGAALVFVAISLFFVQSSISDLLGDMHGIHGNRDFWRFAEQRLHAIADEPDLAPEKKAQIIADLRKLSKKYGPYIDALTDREAK